MITQQQMQRIIEQAKARTAELLAQKGVTVGTDFLPISSSLTTKEKDVEESRPQTSVTNTIITIKGHTFDPYDIPGVGRANKQQQKAIRLFGLEGKSGCLIGPAGTGKTTTMRAAINAAIMSGRIPILSDSIGHKYLRGGVPGIYGGSFTRIATRNLRDNFPEDLQCNVNTIHRLLEFEPEMFDVQDPETKKWKTVRIFKPTRNKFRTLDPSLCSFWLDETSMVGLRLHEQFINAIHPSIKPQIIYIGDIAQLPPVMDDAILGYKMLEFLAEKENTCVELVEVYRHAGVIVNLANHIRTGNTIPSNREVLPYLGNLRKLPKQLVANAIAEWNKEEDGSKVTIHHWKNRLDGEVGQLKALQNLGLGFFPKEIEEGRYNPLTDMILIPYNKAVGTIELNKYISQYLGKKRGAEVFEVIAGFAKHYLAVGDKVFHEREEALITAIKINGMYSGRLPQPSSVTLDRWGHNTAGSAKALNDGQPFDELEALLNIDIGDKDEERKNQASHIIEVRKLSAEEGEKDDTLSTAADINGLIGGYALTVHKSQGSQWKKVYAVFHNSHNRNLQRELLYTAITRAQKELYIICEPETLIQGVLSQRIVGNTLAEKAEYFKGKLAEAENEDDLLNGTNGK